MSVCGGEGRGGEGRGGEGGEEQRGGWGGAGRQDDLLVGYLREPCSVNLQSSWLNYYIIVVGEHTVSHTRTQLVIHSPLVTTSTISAAMPSPSLSPSVQRTRWLHPLTSRSSVCYGGGGVSVGVVTQYIAVTTFIGMKFSGQNRWMSAVNSVSGRQWFLYNVNNQKLLCAFSDSCINFITL